MRRTRERRNTTRSVIYRHADIVKMSKSEAEAALATLQEITKAPGCASCLVNKYGPMIRSIERRITDLNHAALREQAITELPAE